MTIPQMIAGIVSRLLYVISVVSVVWTVLRTPDASVWVYVVGWGSLLVLRGWYDAAVREVENPAS